MEIEYTPAHIAELERVIAELKVKKRVLTTTKIEYENSLTQLNKYKNDKATKLLIVEIKTKMNEVNSSILNLNTKISEKAVLKQDIQQAIKNGKMIVKATPTALIQHNNNIDDDTILRAKFSNLRNKYLNFSSDHTRVSSMRLMAAEFVEEIEIILKNKRSV